MAKGYGISFWNNENVLKLSSHNSVNVLKDNELYTLRRRTVWFLNHIQKAVQNWLCDGNSNIQHMADKAGSSYIYDITEESLFPPIFTFFH